LLAAAQAGVSVRVATPDGYAPLSEVVATASRLGRFSGATIEIGTDAAAAVSGVDAVYTDVWTSMGAEAEANERRARFAAFRVDADLLAHAPGALVMHCLPAHRGEEISAEALDGPRSVALDQAENRLYAQQALLVELLDRVGP
jgi:ornithine carbamoyltransferase